MANNFNNKFSRTFVRAFTIEAINQPNANLVELTAKDGKVYRIKNKVDANGNITTDNISAAQRAGLNIGSTVMCLCSQNKSGGYNVFMPVQYRGMFRYANNPEHPEYNKADINGTSYVLVPAVRHIKSGTRQDGTPYVFVTGINATANRNEDPMWISLAMAGDDAQKFVTMLDERGMIAPDEKGNPSIRQLADGEETVGVFFTVNAIPNESPRSDGNGVLYSFPVKTWEVVK